MIFLSSRGLSTIHPRTNQFRAERNPELPVLAARQILQRRAIHFLELRQIQQRPQAALVRRLNQLVQIRQMPVKQLSSYKNSDMSASELCGNRMTLHFAPWESGDS